MINNLKSAFKNAIIYGAGNLSTKLVGFILLPLYTKHLSVSEYGILGLLEASSQIIISIFGLKLYTAFFRWYWEKEYFNQQKSIYFTTFVSLVFVSAFMSFGVWIFADSFSNFLFNKSEFSNLIFLMSISAGLNIIVQVPLTLMRLQEKSVYYSVSNVFRMVVTLILTIYFVAYGNKKLEGIYLAQIIGQIVFFLFVSKYNWINLTFRFEVKILKDMFIFSFPLILSSIAGILLSVADRYLLKFFGSLSEVGIYSLGFKIANVTKMFLITSVQLAISPMIYKMMNDPNNKRFYSKIMTYFTFGVMFFVIGISIFGQEIVKLLAQNKDYWDAYEIIPIISFAILFEMLRSTSQTGLMLKKKTNILGLVTIFISLLNILFNVLLIPLFQTIGSALANLFSHILFFILIYNFSQKHYFIPYELYKIFKMLIIGICIIIFSLFLDDFNFIVRCLIKITLIFAFPFILYSWKFYEEIELVKLKQTFERWKHPNKWKENLSKLNFK